MYDPKDYIAQLLLLARRDELTHADWYALYRVLLMLQSMAGELATRSGTTADEVLRIHNEKAGRGE